MSITVDCGEGKHDLCTGTGRTAYLIPQESRGYDEPPFFCGCYCHHDGSGTPCSDPECPKQIDSTAETGALSRGWTGPPLPSTRLLERVDAYL